KIGLQNYMRMDGLAFRVLPVRINRRLIDPAVIQKNLFEKYKYRNLNNPDVYFNDNIKALLGNYRSAFLALAQHYIAANQKDKGLEVLDRMSSVIPEEVIPPGDPNISILIGQLYRAAGRPEELKKRLDYVIHLASLSPSQKVQFLPWYSEMVGDPAAAESLAMEILKEEPTLAQAYGFLINQYRREKQYEKGVEVLQKWLAVDPNNSLAKSMMGQMESLMQKDSVAARDTTTKQ
ncbi:MAG: hypothetical protein D6814_10330, partial [Calditrichaeota bacterium]